MFQEPFQHGYIWACCACHDKVWNVVPAWNLTPFTGEFCCVLRRNSFSWRMHTNWYQATLSMHASDCIHIYDTSLRVWTAEKEANCPIFFFFYQVAFTRDMETTMTWSLCVRNSIRSAEIVDGVSSSKRWSRSQKDMFMKADQCEETVEGHAE